MLPGCHKQPTPEAVKFGLPPTLTTDLRRGERILQQFEGFPGLAKIRISACQNCEHVRSADMADSRKERETLFHQSDSLREFAAIRCRPPREELSSAAHHRKVMLLR